MLIDPPFGISAYSVDFYAHFVGGSANMLHATKRCSDLPPTFTLHVLPYFYIVILDQLQVRDPGDQNKKTQARASTTTPKYMGKCTTESVAKKLG